MRERAWLGSRWVWLQAQVSELEYGIRALTELYTHLRQGKVTCFGLFFFSFNFILIMQLFLILIP